MRPKVLVLLIVLGLIFLILMQNIHQVTVSFLFWSFSLPQILFMPLMILIGFAIGFFVGKNSW